MHRIGLTGAILLLVLITSHDVRAQALPGFGGIEVRLGAVVPSQDKTGAGFSADVDLGYLGVPRLRTLVGFNYFRADADRSIGTNPVRGTYDAIGGRVGLRLDAFGPGRLAPFLTGAITGHSVSSDDAEVQALLEGFYVGGSAGLGLSWALGEMRQAALTTEARRVFVSRVGHWAFDIGVRYTPRGPGAYTTDPRRLRREREAEERRQADLRDIRAEQERLAAERLRAERDTADQRRLEREAAAQRERAAQDSARLGEEERRRRAEERDREMRSSAERELAQRELAAQRRRADSLEAARRSEAEARAAADQRAAEERRRAEEAQAAARAAEARASQAERQRYQALLDLHRLISDVTEVRETERGLVVVLGQGLFASGQHALSPRARDGVGTIAAVLSQYPEHRIAVEGHTDSVGSEVANQRLSEQRAESVRAALIGRGIDPQRIELAGYGQSRPVADNTSAQGRAQNRRVEIIILGARRPEGTGG